MASDAKGSSEAHVTVCLGVSAEESRNINPTKLIADSLAACFELQLLQPLLQICNRLRRQIAIITIARRLDVHWHWQWKWGPLPMPTPVPCLTLANNAIKMAPMVVADRNIDRTKQPWSNRSMYAPTRRWNHVSTLKSAWCNGVSFCEPLLRVGRQQTYRQMLWPSKCPLNT